MTRVAQALRRIAGQHVVALIALALVVGGGAAVAAGTVLPKNSVGSKQVKNGALKGKDVRNRSLTGADLRDGTLSGTDVADGSVGASDLAPDAADEVRVVYYSGGSGEKVLWSEEGLGQAEFSLSCGPDYSIQAFAQGGLSPTRFGVYGHELRNGIGEAADTSMLLGAASLARLDDVGQPSGGAGFGGSKFGYGTLVMFFQTPEVDVYVDLRIAQCSATGTVSIDHKPAGSVVTKMGAAGRGARCEASGAAYCTRR